MDGELSIIAIIFRNFIGYDFLIFLLGVFNSVMLWKTMQYAKQLFTALNPQGWVPGGKASLGEVAAQYEQQELSENQLVVLRRKTNLYYTIFENMTSIFPLMGILGTVVSLMPMINAIGDLETGYFFSALTSTFWGIVFAIVFKCFNGYVAAQIEDNEKNVEVFLARNTANLKAEQAKATSEV